MNAIPEMPTSPFGGQCTHCGATVEPGTKAKLSLRIEDNLSRVVVRLCAACVDTPEPSRETPSRASAPASAGQA